MTEEPIATKHQNILTEESPYNYMEQLPLPSPIHYELILQLLERQTMSAASQNPELRHQVNQLIITLRKAVAQQKQLEEACKVYSVDIEHRWSINHHNQEVATPD